MTILSSENFARKPFSYNGLELKVIPGIRRVKYAVTSILKGVYFKLKSDSEPENVTFTVLQCRLLDILRNRINNGEFTERGLARLVGISQPQVHNVLKGVRKLNAHTADLLLHTLKMTVLDLLTQSDMGEHGSRCEMERAARLLASSESPKGTPLYPAGPVYRLKKGPAKELIRYFAPREKVG